MSSFIETILGGKAGSVVTVEPDYAVINDGVSNASVDDISTVAYPDRVMVIYDHDVPTGRPEAAAILRKNLAFADKYQCKYVQAKGIGYQYMVNEVVKPGQIVAGAGTHASIFGAIGALGINVSIPELSRIVETGRYSIVVPETIYVELEGTLPQGTGIMDAAFALLRTIEGVRRKAIEIYAPQLDLHEKEVIMSMICMTGAYAASITETQPEKTDVRFDLADVVPMVMFPVDERKDQARAVIERKEVLSGTDLDAGQIGGYTGGTIEDLRKAADIIEGHTLALGFRLSICPATSRDYILAMEEGLITRFIDYGAQINAAGDHSEVVQGAGAMGRGEKLLTTGLYTYDGAMGMKGAYVYSASVESVARASYTKKI